MIKYADYIHLSSGFPTWNVANCINTGIYAAVDCEIRVVYKGTGANTDRIAGFTHNEVGGGASDSTDFRLFYYENGSLDVWSSRKSSLMTDGIVANGVDYDLTFGNFFCYNNLTESLVYSAASTSMNTNCTIRVDVSSIYLNRLEIKNGGVVVFDGYAALDTSTNTVGLYDKISKQMLTNGLSLTYDNLINTFIIDPDNITFSYDSGSTTVNISADSGWTASTTDSWLTLSDATGTGDTTISVTVANNYNNSSDRVGTVDFTDGEEVLTLTITQQADTRVILKNIYRSGNSVKQMYRSGVKIYQQLMKLTFDVDTDSITFDNTGGTYTINITANEKWTMTIPNWLTASSLSGTGNASIIISTNSVPESKLEGNIIINCTNKTHTIDVYQKSVGPDLTQPFTFETINTCAFNFPSSLSLLGSKNGGEWYSLNGVEIIAGGETLAVKASNDKPTFAYDGSFYNDYYSDMRYNISGNIMSLLYTNNWNTHLDLTAQRQFRVLFKYKKIVSAENLLLPSTGLTNYCYAGMFEHCSSLTTAPALPAPTVPGLAYEFMFNGCPNLNYIKCLATTLESGSSTQYWTNNVASTGTFIKHPSMNSWSRGDGLSLIHI